MTTKPNFFIVGAPKCGTTALYSYLTQHPDVFMPRQKEVHFFGADLHFRRHTSGALEDYLAMFDEGCDCSRRGEASVMYLYSKTAAKEIAEFQSDARIIIMLRHPVDLMHSQHSQLVYSCDEDITDFAEAIAAEEPRRAGRMHNPANLPDYTYYRAVATLSEQVQRYLDTFGRERVHMALLDDLRADSLAVYRDVVRFLGIDEQFRPDMDVVNPNKAVRVPLLHRLATRPPALLRKIQRRFVPRSLRRKVQQRVQDYTTAKVSRPEMDPALRRQLQEEFKAEIESLSKVIDRDLSSWLETEPAAEKAGD